MILADTLSRATLKDTTQSIPGNETTTYAHSVVHHLPVSDEMLRKIRRETSLDPIMLAISNTFSTVGQMKSTILRLLWIRITKFETNYPNMKDSFKRIQNSYPNYVTEKNEANSTYWSPGYRTHQS